jgi:hypothetical protein
MKPKNATFLNVTQVLGIFLDRFMTDCDKNCLLFLSHHFCLIFNILESSRTIFLLYGNIYNNKI